MAAELVLEPGSSASLFRLRFGHRSNYSQPNQTDGKKNSRIPVVQVHRYQHMIWPIYPKRDKRRMEGVIFFFQTWRTWFLGQVYNLIFYRCLGDFSAFLSCEKWIWVGSEMGAPKKGFSFSMGNMMLNQRADLWGFVFEGHPKFLDLWENHISHPQKCQKWWLKNRPSPDFQVIHVMEDICWFRTRGPSSHVRANFRWALGGWKL